MAIIARLSIGFLLLSLAACGHSAANNLYDMHVGAAPTRTSFPVCHGFSCRYLEQVNLTDAEWAQVTAFFEPAPETAEEERTRIANALGMVETLVGPKAGTQDDRRRAPNFGVRGQQDCIDESVNTMTYLNFLDQDGLIRFHEIGPAQTRGKIIIGGWPSNTATVIEKGTGAMYTMDTFFHQNGEAAEVVTIEYWMTGWKPPRKEYEVER